MKDYSECPWLGWLHKYFGYKESVPAQNKFLSQFWKFVHLAYTTITGADHAWCAMIMTASLHETGFSTANATAAAASYRFVGFACPLKFGALVVLTRVDENGKRHFHVTCCEEVVSAAPGHEDFYGTGGNQHDQICTEHFVCGPNQGQWQIAAIRWPLKNV